jgi:hypothetical protein
LERCRSDFPCGWCDDTHAFDHDDGLGECHTDRQLFRPVVGFGRYRALSMVHHFGYAASGSEPANRSGDHLRDSYGRRQQQFRSTGSGRQFPDRNEGPQHLGAGSIGDQPL